VTTLFGANPCFRISLRISVTVARRSRRPDDRHRPGMLLSLMPSTDAIHAIEVRTVGLGPVVRYCKALMSTKHSLVIRSSRGSIAYRSIPPAERVLKDNFHQYRNTARLRVEQHWLSG